MVATGPEPNAGSSPRRDSSHGKARPIPLATGPRRKQREADTSVKYIAAAGLCRLDDSLGRKVIEVHRLAFNAGVLGCSADTGKDAGRFGCGSFLVLFDREH